MASNIISNQNKLKLAPVVLLGDLFYSWQKNHIGNKDDYYKFLTQPSADRSLFLLENQHPNYPTTFFYDRNS